MKINLKKEVKEERQEVMKDYLRKVIISLNHNKSIKNSEK